jgi:hypothetical protein
MVNDKAQKLINAIIKEYITAKAAKDANDKAIDTEKKSKAAEKKAGVKNPESEKKVKKAADFAKYHNKEAKEAAEEVRKLGKNLGNKVLAAAKNAAEKVEKARILTNELKSAKEEWDNKQHSYSITANEYNRNKENIEKKYENEIKEKVMLEDRVKLIYNDINTVNKRTDIDRNNKEDLNNENYFQIKVINDKIMKIKRLIVEEIETPELIKNNVLAEKAMNEAYKLLEQTTKKLKIAMKEKNDAVKAVVAVMNAKG